MQTPPDSPLPLLFSYRRCPYAMRARMALLQAGRPFQAFEVSLRDKPAALLALSPKGTVPVLRLPSGRVLEQSWDIMAWSFESERGDAMAAAWWSPAQSERNHALLQANDGCFKRLLDRYKYPERFADEAVSREQVRSEALETFLDPLSQRLEREAFLGGEAACATDLALFPFVRQFAAVEPLWFAAQPLPALQAWLELWLSSRLFAACMVKLPAQEAVVFPACGTFQPA